MTAATEIWSYRNLIYNLAQRELRSRYKKSVLGWLWSLVNPAATLAIYSLVFGIFLRIPPEDLPDGRDGIFGLYLFSALVVWNFFNSTMSGSIAALQSSGGLLNKVYFPPSCPAIANMFTVLLQALIEGAILAFVMILLGNAGITFVLFPFVLVVTGFFGLGLGLILSVYNVRYRDVGYIVGIAMQVLFYTTPIIYGLKDIPGEALGLPVKRIISLNPLTQFVEWSRDAFYRLQWPSPGAVVTTTVASLAVFGIGWWVFSVKTRDIAEEL
jgi:ABC-type polysaccharide/polyol phosphate export permease